MKTAQISKKREQRMKHVFGMTALVAAFLITLSAGTALATEEHYGNEDYATLAGRKLGRGASNTALGWLEFPTGIQEIGEQHGVGAAATWGVLHGAGRTVQRTAVGIFELLTFPFGVPQDFEPLIEPEFILQDSR